jgi:GGDEF domain-containing protein
MAIEYRIRHRDGGWRHMEAMASNAMDEPAIAGLVLNNRDATERKALEEQLTHRALHDPLTELANRALFHDRVHHVRRRRGDVAVLFLDVDDFKTVNDVLGHAAGDELLTRVAAQLRTAVRP